jgi:polyisoprenoid-binding protein YceI
MKKTISLLAVLVLFTAASFAQGFKVKASGEQTFNFDDKNGRNQVSFNSSAVLETIKGLSNDVKGTVTFKVSDLKTLKGKLSVTVSSIKTGIDMRDEHLRSTGWLDAAAYPEISFEIKKVNSIKSEADNKLVAKVSGVYTMHGVSKDVIANVTLTYLDENETTKTRAPGDLLGVKAELTIKLTDYGISSKVVGQKVADNIDISVDIFGTNTK